VAYQAGYPSAKIDESKDMKKSRWQVLRYSSYVLLGGLLTGLSCHQVAQSIYRRGLKYSESKCSAGFICLFTTSIANEQYHSGDKEAALKLMSELVQRYPDKPSPHHSLAILYMRYGDYPQALEYLERAHQLEENPKRREEIENDLASLRSILRERGGVIA
jgi:tetratricopeptide (TPR) repeat protein